MKKNMKIKRLKKELTEEEKLQRTEKVELIALKFIYVTTIISMVLLFYTIISIVSESM